MLYMYTFQRFYFNFSRQIHQDFAEAIFGRPGRMTFTFPPPIYYNLKKENVQKDSLYIYY